MQSIYVCRIEEHKMPRTVSFILAAGEAQRARYLSNPTLNKFAMAKPRFPILNTPVMHHFVMELRSIGAGDNVFVNVHSNLKSVTNFYDFDTEQRALPPSLRPTFVDHGKLNGTLGDVVKTAVEHAHIQDDDEVFVMCGDILTDASFDTLRTIHRETGADITEYFYPIEWAQVPESGTVLLGRSESEPQTNAPMPQKKDRLPEQPQEDYAGYLEEHEKFLAQWVACSHVDVPGRTNKQRSFPVLDFKEKAGLDTCCSNLNDASIGIMKGSVLRALYAEWNKDNRFRDFSRDGFRFALEHKLNFQGVVLPRTRYWMDIGDAGKFWLAIMDTLDGYFDRSRWPIFGPDISLQPRGKITFIDPSVTFEDRNSVLLVPPYFIGANSFIGRGAHIERAAIASNSVIGENAHVFASAILEPAFFNEGDKVRELAGSGTIGGMLSMSLLASGLVPARQRINNSIIYTNNLGITEVSPNLMDPSLSYQRARDTRRFYSLSLNNGRV